MESPKYDTKPQVVLITETMAEESQPPHIAHRRKGVAYHIEWEFRRKALIWSGHTPAGPNFYPVGSDLRHWLLRNGDLRILSSKDKTSRHAYTNPYTCDASVLAVAYATIVNDSTDFAESVEHLESIDASIRAIRLYTENVLYVARLCEALIKQLLYCTSFPEKYYRKATLRSLLSRDCTGCRSSNEKPHDLSLLGSLAHRYRLCHDFDDCLNDHLKLVNEHRDVEAAHSGIVPLPQGSTLAVRESFGKEYLKYGKLFVHMLEHVSELESRMLSALNSTILKLRH